MINSLTYIGGLISTLSVEEQNTNTVIFLANDGCYYCFTTAESAIIAFSGKSFNQTVSVGEETKIGWREEKTVQMSNNALIVEKR